MKTITIDGVEYITKKDSEKEVASAKKSKVVYKNTKPSPFEVGKAYFIRTVTYFATGRVTAIHGDFIELEDAAWIADTGRLADALEKGSFDEVEPINTIYGINTQSIVDYFEWSHELPLQQK